jgi:deoxyribodipyrimidine photolyase-related protein
MKTLWIFGHQLSTNQEGFLRINKSQDIILMIEARSRANWKKYHKKKLVLIFSAMRHFAEALKEQGYRVDYRVEDSFSIGWKKHHKAFAPREVIFHEPTDYAMRKLLLAWILEQEKSSLEITRLSDSHFLVSEEEWKTYLPQNKAWKLDAVYQKLRRRFSVLMDGENPMGGKWSYDAQNRKPPKVGSSFVDPLFFEPDSITRDVMFMVDEAFPDNPGATEPFTLPVESAQANALLDHFLSHRLQTFGDYQDAMIQDLPYMSHSLISSSLNIGLLEPLDVIRKAEACFHEGTAPLAATEGFIRQILGWREYIRGIYLLKMPEYKDSNAFDHVRPLPWFYWDAHTKMNCLHQSVKEVLENGYNHHIQRLMVLGNFANLAGIQPQAVSEWFNTMYTDAHDWVVLPNVLGMALYADGGSMSTKPYISSGQYVHKMSNYCDGCAYQIKEKWSENACPFNALYWDFLMRHKSKLEKNPRMALMYGLLGKMKKEDQEAWKTKAQTLLSLLDQGLL